MKKKEAHKDKEYRDILNCCQPNSMFEDMLHNIQSKTTFKHMPVRKFFDNTFNNLLNDALFAL